MLSGCVLLVCWFLTLYGTGSRGSCSCLVYVAGTTSRSSIERARGRVEAQIDRSVGTGTRTSFEVKEWSEVREGTESGADIELEC